MAIVQTMTETTFVGDFMKIRPDNFTPEALRIVFAYYDELSNDTGESIEFDPIAICCEYSEEHPNDIASNYDINLSDSDDDELTLEEVEEYLQDRTHVMGVTDSGNIIYQQF